MKKSTFRRRADGTGDATPAKELPRATYPNVHNVQQLQCSLGLHAWDELWGGGALVTGMASVSMDHPTHYAKALARFYCGQALHDGHALLVVAAADAPPEPWVRSQVPAAVTSAPTDRDVVTRAPAADALRIAWRYRAQVAERPLGGSDAAGGRLLRRAHHFDLSRAADAATTSDVRTLLHGVDEEPEALYERVAAALEEHTRTQVARSDGGAVPIVRVLFVGFGSGLWWDAPLQLRFVSRMRALLRRSLATALWLMAPSSITPELRHCFDHALSVRAFAPDDGEAKAYEGFHGIMEVERTPALFAAAHATPECTQFLFRRTRRNLHIERLYLPPEDAGQSPGLGCATTGGGGPLDF